MKICLLLLSFLCCTVALRAQYGNEWIDYQKTYYKCKVGQTGMCRISTETLQNSGLGSVPAEQFQLWHNGQEVRLYTSAATGVLPSGGFIQFYGERNDGAFDDKLYKDPANHLNKAWSLQTDTSAYFLTVNGAGSNLRYANTANNVQGNTLPAEPYFIYTYPYDFRKKINRGKGYYYGETIYSSTYDVGEFWSSDDIFDSSSLAISMPDLNVAASGPAATMSVGAAGNGRGTSKRINVALNGVSYINQPLPEYTGGLFTAQNIPLSALSSNKANVVISNQTPRRDSFDYLVTGFVHITYPHTFNLGGAGLFSFTLPASVNGNYIEITNFNDSGAIAPVLYDITNGERYAANTSTRGILKFRLTASAADRSLVLVNENPVNLVQLPSLVRKTFTDYSQIASQGDYLIISNAILLSGGSDVEQYRQYRSSAAGGGYNAKIYDADDLVDQFAYGIKKHPLGIKNFLQYTRDKFGVKPKFVFIIGKGVAYDSYRYNEGSPLDDRLNLVPTFGWPASDILLTSNNLEPVPATPIGRLSVVRSSEVRDYLNKIKEYEQNQVASTAQTIDSRAWMKTVVDVVGANSTGEDNELSGYLNIYASILKDTLFGGDIHTFNKSTTGEVTPITDAALTNLFNNGISIINYFGHSSNTALNYNLNDPNAYSNAGKYPFFLASGCDAGDFYGFDTTRFSILSLLAEKYVLAPERGAIAMLGSSSFGVGSYLNYYNTGFYRTFSGAGYNQPISVSLNGGNNTLLSIPTYDPFSTGTKLLHAEETILHGDPAIRINAFVKPDFVVEEPQIVITPTLVSVADTSFSLKTYFYNIGKATGDSVSVTIRRQYPDGTSAIMVSKQIRSVRYRDSVLLTVPIVASRDRGQNRITVTIDDANRYDELSETNNTATKTFLIYEDELTPVYPYSYAIVNRSNIKLAASTADPTLPSRQYAMEIDTTALFNSPLKVVKTVTSLGGLVEFEPGLSFTDSTVYYWRVAPVPAANEAYRWNNSSFIYLANSSYGYNQSHLYQHLRSATDRIYLDSNSRAWNYIDRQSQLKLTNSVYGVSGTLDGDFEVRVNESIITQSACLGYSVIYNVFDPITLQPLINQAKPSTVDAGTGHGGFLGSAAACEGQGSAESHIGSKYNFEFSYLDTTGRRKMRDFMDWVPSGDIVTARIILAQVNGSFNNNPFVSDYKADQQVYGVGNSWYDRLITAGFTSIDSFTYPRIWNFAYRKNTPSFEPAQQLSAGLSDRIVTDRVVLSPDSLGFITSPQFGPAKAWKRVLWRGKTADASAGDKASVDVIGVTANGTVQTLYTLSSSQTDFDISAVDAAQYPYIRLQMRNADSIHFTPYQLQYWRVLYDPVPEGALSAAVAYTYRDTLAVGEVVNGKIGFKNVSDVAFADSIKVNAVIYNKANTPTVVPVNPNPLKKLAPGDTATIHFTIDSKNFSGANTFYLDVNPDGAQPEQTHANNFMYKGLLVSTDNFKPLLDVTFDGVHILNNDIVSAKPYITVKLTDESQYLLLNDTSLISVQLQYPDGSLRKFSFTNDTLRFTPAAAGSNNVATVEFLPYLPVDGDYKLLVSGKDRQGNSAGNTQYSVSFKVFNKPMISDMFNYPNPFTTSTAFVFTVTGSQVPQNLRIQVLTITGKIVKEITKEELGDIHIGRNITEYKWDGTDQYGQKLGNGVYLYRVLTNLDGKSLDRFAITDRGSEVNTSQYFNKGYGKMYLMR